MMSLLRFRALNVVVVLLSMQCQKVLGFHQKYLNWCSEDWCSYRFGTTCVINDIILIFGMNYPFNCSGLVGGTSQKHFRTM